MALCVGLVASARVRGARSGCPLLRLSAPLSLGLLPLLGRTLLRRAFVGTLPGQLRLALLCFLLPPELLLPPDRGLLSLLLPLDFFLPCDLGPSSCQLGALRFELLFRFSGGIGLGLIGWLGLLQRRLDLGQHGKVRHRLNGHGGSWRRGFGSGCGRRRRG